MTPETEAKAKRNAFIVGILQGTVVNLGNNSITLEGNEEARLFIYCDNMELKKKAALYMAEDKEVKALVTITRAKNKESGL